MDRGALRQAFYQSDGPLAVQLVMEVELLGTEADQRCLEALAYLTHRLKGDARLVGFANIGVLAGAMETLVEALPPAPCTATEAAQLALMQAACEIRDRLVNGDDACLAEPSAALLARIEAATAR